MGFLSRLSEFMFEHSFLGDSEEELSSRRADAIAIKNANSSQRDPLKALAKKVALVLGGDGRDFVEPEADLAVVEAAYNTEAYIRQGVDKYIDKMFKAGWKFVGKNPTTVDYIRIRFAYMAEATQLPTEKLFIEYAEDVVKFSNAIIAKSRMSDQNQLPPNLTIQGYAGRQPVTGYFPVNVTTIKVKRDKFGAVKQWEQEIEGGGSAAKFKPEDMIHTYYKRTKGNAFGTPFVTPVLDDIRALRQAEDNVLKMMYRNINPFYHIKVGSEEYPADDPEIIAAKQEVEGMDVDGGLVTSERWEIRAIAADKVIDANPYLKYFEERVFSGLGVPATMFGRGSTANKSTSENQSAEFIDRVKAFQRAIEADVDEFMIKELLLEGGFDPILNPDDMVHFRFNEIDIDMQVKLENHAIFKYEHNAITEDEMRQLLGLDVLNDRSKMFIELITLYQAERTAQISQQYGVSAQGNNQSKPTEKGNSETNNKVKPKNQHNPQGKEAKKSKDEYLSILQNHLDELNEQINDLFVKYYNGNKDALEEIATQISFKEFLLIDIYNQSFNDEATKNRITNTFNTLRAEVTDTILSVKSTDDVAIEVSIETTNCVFKVIQNTILHYFQKEV